MIICDIVRVGAVTTRRRDRAATGIIVRADRDRRVRRGNDVRLLQHRRDRRAALRRTGAAAARGRGGRAGALLDGDRSSRRRSAARSSASGARCRSSPTPCPTSSRSRRSSRCARRSRRARAAIRRRCGRSSPRDSAGSGVTGSSATCALLFTWANLVFEGIFLVLIVVGRRQGLSGARSALLIAVFGVCSLARLTRRAARCTVGSRCARSWWLRSGCSSASPPSSSKPNVYVLARRVLPVGASSARASTRSIIGYRMAVVSRPAYRPRQQRRADDRALRHAARPARRRPPARFVLRAYDRRGLRGLPLRCSACSRP